MIIIPALDLLDNQVVRLKQGDFKDKIVYSEDPITLASNFRDAKCQHLHIVDLTGAKQGAVYFPHYESAVKIKESTKCSIEIGGGIRSFDDVQHIFDLGLSPLEDLLMIGSLPIKSPDEFNKIVKHYNSSILVTIDVYGDKVRISGWQEKTTLSIDVFFEQLLDLGVSNFLVTQIKRDGMLQGPDYDLYEQICIKFTNYSFSLTISGGISTVSDLHLCKDSSIKYPQIKAVILGKAYYEKKISLADVKKIQIVSLPN